MFRGKRIILCVHEYADFSAIIKEGLEHLGFTVIGLNVKQPDFKYQNIWQRLHNLFRKIILGDKTFKQKLKQKAVEQKLLKQLEGCDPADYALLIRADILPRSVIELIRKKSSIVSAYQWDGLDRFPTIFEYIPLFDRFFVFDPQDLITKNTLPATNFYFDHIDRDDVKASKQITFTGSYFSSRNELLKDISNILSAKGIKIDISIFSKHDEEIAKIKKWGFKHIDSVIPYRENLKKVVSSDFLLDVHINEHNGLSFRIFEAMNYEKKIITTNTTVKRYDFYNESNIFVWGDDDIERLEEFLSTPYLPIAKEIRDKYAFSNWISYLLDYRPYQQIDLPSS